MIRFADQEEERKPAVLYHCIDRPEMHLSNLGKLWLGLLLSTICVGVIVASRGEFGWVAYYVCISVTMFYAARLSAMTYPFVLLYRHLKGM